MKWTENSQFLTLWIDSSFKKIFSLYLRVMRNLVSLVKIIPYSTSNPVIILWLGLLRAWDDVVDLIVMHRINTHVFLPYVICKPILSNSENFSVFKIDYSCTFRFDSWNNFTIFFDISTNNVLSWIHRNIHFPTLVAIELIIHNCTSQCVYNLNSSILHGFSVL